MPDDGRVPLERLEAMERQLFPTLPNSQIGRDIRSVVLEVLTARKAEALDPAISDIRTREKSA